MSFPFDRVIWDFNGTILDDLAVGIASADELLLRYGLPPIGTVERYYEVFGFPIRDYYERIGFDFTKTDYSVLAHEWVEIYLRRVKTATVRDGILSAIQMLSEWGVRQTVLSMTESGMLLRQIEELGLAGVFDEICGLDNIYAKSKLELASAWRERHPDERVLLIGDTSHDAESAAIIGCECFLLTGGHQSRESLTHSGYPVFNTADEGIRSYWH
jgi:phosphoglycolate phosphatase